MGKNKKTIYIAIGFFVLIATMASFIFQSELKNLLLPLPVQANLEAQPASIISLKGDEKIVNVKSYNEKKVTIVTLTYKNMGTSDIKDPLIILNSKGTPAFIAVTRFAGVANVKEPPRRDALSNHLILDSSKDIVFNIFKPSFIATGKTQKVEFYIYSRKAGRLTLQAEINSGNEKVKSNFVAIDVK